MELIPKYSHLFKKIVNILGFFTSIVTIVNGNVKKQVLLSMKYVAYIMKLFWFKINWRSADFLQTYSGCHEISQAAAERDACKAVTLLHSG